MAFWIPLGVVVIILAWFVATYNRLVTAKNAADNSWSDIDVQLKRRYDLIPNMVEAVKGYATHEKSVFENVAAARSAAMNAKTPAEHATAENMLTNTLKTLFAVSENYPELKASENFMRLQSELRDAEDKIEHARRFYNANVRDWNTLIQKVPTNIVASLLKFANMQFFEVAAGSAEREAPKVQF